MLRAFGIFAKSVLLTLARAQRCLLRDETSENTPRFKIDSANEAHANLFHFLILTFMRIQTRIKLIILMRIRIQPPKDPVPQTWSKVHLGICRVKATP